MANIPDLICCVECSYVRRPYATYNEVHKSWNDRWSGAWVMMVTSSKYGNVGKWSRLRKWTTVFAGLDCIGCIFSIRQGHVPHTHDLFFCRKATFDSVDRAFLWKEALNEFVPLFQLLYPNMGPCSHGSIIRVHHKKWRLLGFPFFYLTNVVIEMMVWIIVSLRENNNSSDISSGNKLICIISGRYCDSDWAPRINCMKCAVRVFRMRFGPSERKV